MNVDQVNSIIERQRTFFASHAMFDVSYRIAALELLYEGVRRHEAEIAAALHEDLGKSLHESYMCEIGLSLDEIRYQMSHVKDWAKPRRRRTHLANFHAKSFTVQEPYGEVLIMAPWNYPFLLTLEPLAGALAAGNCCVIKPSAYAPASSKVLRAIIEESLPPDVVAVVEGGREENAALLEARWDYIFFTGSVNVGKLVMEKAAANLTPVSLELGGKSPCVVTDNCNLKVAAARIAFGKYLNLGQTCVAPDYCLVDAKVKDEFLKLLFQQIKVMYGTDALVNPDYGKMINKKHYDRVLGLVDKSKVVYGGEADPETLRIAPIVMDRVTPDDAVMQEEIFGPVLPAISYDTIDEAVDFITSREKPLALYLFAKDKATQQRFLRFVPFGGGCINDTIMHLATPEMGFGGVGHSGMGSYHGKKSFDTFSHEKSIIQKYTYIDMPMRYQPYSWLNLKIIRLFIH